MKTLAFHVFVVVDFLEQNFLEQPSYFSAIRFEPDLLFALENFELNLKMSIAPSELCFLDRDF